MSITAALAGILAADPTLAGIPVSRDEPAARASTARPYILVSEGVSTARDSSSAVGAVRLSELVQVTLFQDRLAAAEDFTLSRRMRALIEVAPPQRIDGWRAFRLRPESSVRLFDAQTRTVSDALTVRVVSAL